MKKKKSNRKKIAERTIPVIAREKTVSDPVTFRDQTFWQELELYNGIDANKRADKLDELGITIESSEVLGQLTKSHFVIPGKTRFECQQCGECCRYARKIAMFSYEPCPFLEKNNLCRKHDSHYQVCKWFPFWLYPDKKFGNLLTIKPYCSGYGKGEPVDYESKTAELIKLRNSAIIEPDGAEVIHEVLYLPDSGEWKFPSAENVNSLITAIAKINGKQEKHGSTPKQIEHARQYTSGLLSGSQDANLTVNEYGIITDVNAQAMSLLEAEYDKLVGSEFGGLFGSRDKGRVLLRKCLALGKITGVPQKFSCRSKTFFAFCDAMSYRDRNDGLIHGILVAVRPISEEIYNELIHSQNYARGLIESSIDPMVALDRDGMITDVNESTISITGWTREKLIGSFFRDYFTEPDRAGGGIKHVLAYNYVRDYELDLMTCGGDVIPVSFNASIFRNPDGIPVGIFAIARDIRSARHASKKLEEMYGYARGLIESSIDPMVALDSDGVITDVNEATMSITRRARGELIGSFFKNYFTEPAKAGDGIRQVLEHDFVRDYRLDLKAHEGKVIPVSFNASIYRKPDGVPAGIFAIARVL